MIFFHVFTILLLLEFEFLWYKEGKRFFMFFSNINFFSWNFHYLFGVLLFLSLTCMTTLDNQAINFRLYLLQTFLLNNYLILTHRRSLFPFNQMYFSLSLWRLSCWERLFPCSNHRIIFLRTFLHLTL